MNTFFILAFFCMSASLKFDKWQLVAWRQHIYFQKDYQTQNKKTIIRCFFFWFWACFVLFGASPQEYCRFASVFFVDIKVFSPFQTETHFVCRLKPCDTQMLAKIYGRRLSKLNFNCLYTYEKRHISTYFQFFLFKVQDLTKAMLNC